MPAYHDVDNESIHASRHLLTKVLREEWGFDGLIVADYIGISLLYQHHNLAKDPAAAAAMAFAAGLDIELPADECAAHLAEAMKRGLITQETIDEIVKRIRREDPPGPVRAAVRRRRRDRPPVAGHLEVAQVARQAVVVLENKGVCPRSEGQRIAVINPPRTTPPSFAATTGHDPQRAETAGRSRRPRSRGLSAPTRSRSPRVATSSRLQVRLSGVPGDVESTTLRRPRQSRSRWTSSRPPWMRQAADVTVVCGRPRGPLPDRHRGRRLRRRLDLPGVNRSARCRWRRESRLPVLRRRPYNLGGLEDKVARS
jgi:beta-glucosidase